MHSFCHTLTVLIVKRRAINNQKYSEGTVESKFNTVLNNVFPLSTSVCEFYDYENSKAIYDTFVLPVLNKLDTTEFDNMYLDYNDELHKKLLSVYSSNSDSKFKNGIDQLIRPFMMYCFFGRIWFNNYKAFEHILWNGLDIKLVVFNR